MVTDGRDLARQIQQARVVVARFGPIVEAGLSDEWTDAVTEEPDWEVSCDLMSRMRDETRSVGVEHVTGLLESLGVLLDLWDEDPTGATYYPYKAAELIELHCRMVTGDLSDDAPVGLDEWIGRFARHVDWQMAKRGINLATPQYFSTLEEEMKARERELNGVEETALRAVLHASGEAAHRYIDALRSALAD